jgi:hypothetical protein
VGGSTVHSPRMLVFRIDLANPMRLLAPPCQTPDDEISGHGSQVKKSKCCDGGKLLLFILWTDLLDFDLNLLTRSGQHTHPKTASAPLKSQFIVAKMNLKLF